MAELRGARVALLSGRGMVGRALVESLARHGAEVHVYSRPEVDLARPSTLARIFERARPDWVVNGAAYTAVDRAEEEEALATRVNGEAVGLLARACAERGAKLVHYSTDYVFDGSARAPIPVDAAIAPINAYGRSKAAGEIAVREALPGAHLLIRTSWVYAPWGTNFVRTIAELAATRDVLRVVDDQRGRPTSAEELAERTCALMGRDARGTLHVTDEGECTWYELASAVVELTGSRCRVEPCTTDEFPRPARRPAYGVLDLSKTHALVGHGRPWREAVARVLEKMVEAPRVELGSENAPDSLLRA